MTLDDHVKKWLRIDADDALEEMAEIADERKHNIIVMDPDYKAPTCGGPEVPLSSSIGLYAYWERIRSAAEYALQNGYIPSELMPPRAPDYMRKLESPNPLD